jgi:ATP-dependent helicase/nuclease subunit A
MPVEMYILDEDPANDEAGEGSGDEGSGDPGGLSGQGQNRVISPAQRQAAFVASRIRRMVGADSGSSEFQIFDKETGRTRPVEYRDIVILMRSLSGRANEYVQVLQLAGVPVSSQSSAGYFAATEITDCVSVLKVLDNPRQDIELAAVLRSAIFRVTDSELAMIRSCKYEGPAEVEPGFYDRAINYIECGESEDLRCKLRNAFDLIERWRIDARRGDLAELIWSVLRTTDYLSFVSALANGPQRRANLLKLHDRAIQFEGFTGGGQAKSLTRFVDFIEKLLKEGQDWAPAQTENATENAVRIMSIHKSKGLEFPVVFLAELNRRFNKKDSFGDCLIDETETIGLTIIDHESRVKLPGMAHEIIAEKKLDQTIAEEMRLLYVAVTRARERLVLTATQKANHCSSIVHGCGILGQAPLADWQLRQAQCHFDWLLYGLGDQRQLHDLFGVSGDGDVADDDLFVARLLAADEPNEIADRILRSAYETADRAKEAGAMAPAQLSRTAKSLTDKIKASLNWRYPFESATEQRAKESVSLRTHRSDEFAKKSFTAALKQVPKAVSKDIAPDRREIGTAVHLVIRHLDLSGPVSTGSVQAVIEELTGSGLIAKETASRIDIGSIEKFFASQLGAQAISAGNRLLREWPFTLAIDADGGTAGETTILQGIIDMIIPTAAGFIIVDFKTDDVTAESAGRRAETYAGQLEYYGQAAGAILEGKIAAKWLYFLKPGLAVAVNS